MSRAPFEKLRVLDLGRVLAAPFTSQLLGDLGAEVIKVERPGSGDDSRQYGPPFVYDSEGGHCGHSAFFVSVNRNKKSVTVDITKPQGQDLIRQLVRQSDVMIENYKVGDLARYGLDYESVRQVHPGIVYCSLTGFGQTGPYRERLAYDNIFQAMSGLMSVTGLPDGVPGGGAMKTGPSLGDIIAGQVAFGAITAALYHRDANGGTGQHVDVAALDALIAANSHYCSHYLLSGEPPVRRGTEGNNVVPSRLFRCADGDIVLSAGNDAQFRRLCEVLGQQGLADDSRFATNPARAANRQALAILLEPLAMAWQVKDLVSALEAVGVPGSSVYDMAQVFADPHVQARSMSVEIDHPTSATGKVSVVGHPVKYSETPVDRYVSPPRLGEHTDAVLQDVLGMSPEQIAVLRDAKVI